MKSFNSKFTIILIFSALLLIPAQAFPEKSISDIRAENLKQILKENLKEKIQELKTKLKDKDHIPVIIELNTNFKPEGDLDLYGIISQKNRIKDDQKKLIDFLYKSDGKKIKTYEHVPLIALDVDKNALDILEISSLVSTISEDVLLEPQLTQSVPLVGAPVAWSNGASGQGQAVAILDTGVEKTHQMLSGKIISEACYSSNEPNNPATIQNEQSFSVCPGGVEAITGPDTALPCSFNGCDHGTHVAGIAAGNGGGLSGVAKDSKIIAIQIFSMFPDTAFCASNGAPAPCILTYTSDLILGLDRIMTLSNSIDISSVNLSVGGGGPFTSEAQCDGDPIKPYVDSLRSVGIATIASSGNDGWRNALVTPACISSVISVGATTKSDAITSYSNIASFLDLLAPGHLITSSVLGNNFAAKSGTSMSAPHVTGAWAVLKSADNGATVDEVLNSLKTTGFPIFYSDNNYQYTFPRIQVDSALNDLVPPLSTPWYNTNWQLRKSITIDHTKVSASLTDFPVLVSITDANLASSALANGNDILFTASDGITKLSHEIEDWDKNTGKLTAWVRVPSLSSITDTGLYMYYSNTGASNQQDLTGGTWNSNYESVYHLHNDFLDSTSNNNDGNNIGSTDVSAAIADGQSFDGNNDWVDYNDINALDGLNDMTVSAWVKLDSTTSDMVLASKFLTVDNRGSWMLWFDDVGSLECSGKTDVFSMFIQYSTSSVSSKRACTNSVNVNTWYHVVGTWNHDDAIRIYLNGQLVNTVAGASVLMNSNAEDVRLGATASGAKALVGDLDEVRMLKTELTPAWIQTEFFNQISPETFYTIGGEEGSF